MTHILDVLPPAAQPGATAPFTRWVAGRSPEHRLTNQRCCPPPPSRRPPPQVAMKIGRGDWSPRSSGVEPKKDWKLACSGHNWAAWRCDQ